MTSPPDPAKPYLRNIHLAVLGIGLLLLVGVAMVTQALNYKPRQAQAAQDAGMVLETATVQGIVDGKDAETGLIAADGYLVVKQNCTGCHSSKLITQNHLSRERWEKSIRWMQKNQNLGDLGVNEPIILDYLAKYYGPLKQGRRKPLEQPKWYRLP